MTLNTGVDAVHVTGVSCPNCHGGRIYIIWKGPFFQKQSIVYSRTQ